jgi:hypothetical protein
MVFIDGFDYVYAIYVVKEYIHIISQRFDQFVTIDCSTILEDKQQHFFEDNIFVKSAEIFVYKLIKIVLRRI